MERHDLQVDEAISILTPERREILNRTWVCVPGELAPEYQHATPEQIDMLNRPMDDENSVYLMNVGEVIDPNLVSFAALYVQTKYGPRAFGLYSGTGTVIIGEDTPEEFIDYQNMIRGKDVNTIMVDFNDPSVSSITDALGEEELAGKELRAYMPHMRLLKKLNEVGAQLKGWTEESMERSEKLNNKFKIIEWLREEKTKEKLVALGLIDEHTNAAPHAVETRQNNLLNSAKERLEEVEELYDRHEESVAEYYKQRGLTYEGENAKIIIRPSWGGGSYETFSIEKSGKGVDKDSGETVDLYSLGHEGKKLEHQTWEEVEDYINEQFQNNGASDNYTITRFLDTVEDPGINAVVLSNGDTDSNFFYVAPPHGQVLEGTMCVGTQTDTSLPEDKLDKKYHDGTTPRDERSRAMHLGKAREMTAFVVNHMAQKATGDLIMGVDVMETGIFEAALAEAVKGTEDEFEAVGEHVVAEANMRPTQRTMHQLTQEAIIRTIEFRSNEPVTYADVLIGFEQGGAERFFTSHDSYSVTRRGWNRVVAAFNQDDANNEIFAVANNKPEGVYIIMPPVKWEDETSTVGIGVMGENTDQLREYLNKLRQISNGHLEDHEDNITLDHL